MRGRSTNGSGRSLTPGGSYGVGDLPAASAVNDSDTQPICQSPNGCFAADASVTLHGVRQSQLAAYYQSKFFGVAPITYNAATGDFGLAYDPATLAIVGGVLTVIGGAPPPTGGGGAVDTGGGGAVDSGGGGAVDTGGGAAAMRAQIAALEARLAALEAK